MSVEDFIQKVKDYHASVPAKMVIFEELYSSADEASKKWTMNSSKIIPEDLFQEWKSLIKTGNPKLIKYTEEHMDVIFGYLNPLRERTKEYYEFLNRRV